MTMVPTFRHGFCQTASALLTAFAFSSLMVALLASGYRGVADENLGPQPPQACQCTDYDCLLELNCPPDEAPVCPGYDWCSTCVCNTIGAPCGCHTAPGGGGGN